MVLYRVVPAGRDGQRGWAIEMTLPSERPVLIKQFHSVAEAQAALDRLKVAQLENHH